MSSNTRPLQVIVLGHKLSRATALWLRKQGPYKVYRVYFHIPRFDQVFETVRQVFTELHEQGCDLSGETPTVFQCVGSTVGALAVAAMWQGLTGNLPRLLNLIRISEEEYGPSRELPVLELDDFREECAGEARRWGVKVTEETLESMEIDDDGLALDGVISMSSLRGEARKLRADLEEPRSPHR